MRTFVAAFNAISDVVAGFVATLKKGELVSINDKPYEAVVVETKLPMRETSVFLRPEEDAKKNGTHKVGYHKIGSTGNWTFGSTQVCPECGAPTIQATEGVVCSRYGLGMSTVPSIPTGRVDQDGNPILRTEKGCAWTGMHGLKARIGSANYRRKTEVDAILLGEESNDHNGRRSSMKAALKSKDLEDAADMLLREHGIVIDSLPESVATRSAVIGGKLTFGVVDADLYDTAISAVHAVYRIINGSAIMQANTRAAWKAVKLAKADGYPVGELEENLRFADRVIGDNKTLRGWGSKIFTSENWMETMASSIHFPSEWEEEWMPSMPSNEGVDKTWLDKFGQDQANNLKFSKPERCVIAEVGTGTYLNKACGWARWVRTDKRVIEIRAEIAAKATAVARVQGKSEQDAEKIGKAAGEKYPVSSLMSLKDSQWFKKSWAIMSRRLAESVVPEAMDPATIIDPELWVDGDDGAGIWEHVVRHRNPVYQWLEQEAGVRWGYDPIKGKEGPKVTPEFREAAVLRLRAMFYESKPYGKTPGGMAMTHTVVVISGDDCTAVVTQGHNSLATFSGSRAATREFVRQFPSATIKVVVKEVPVPKVKSSRKQGYYFVQGIGRMSVKAYNKAFPEMS